MLRKKKKLSHAVEAAEEGDPLLEYFVEKHFVPVIIVRTTKRFIRKRRIKEWCAIASAVS